jgi:hypothetical protein
MSERPTDSAKSWYGMATNLFRTLHGMSGRGELEMKNSFALLGRAFDFSSQGHADLATALRATYMKLEEIDRRLARIEGARR